VERPVMRAALAVVVFSACLYLPVLGERDFWAPDEPKYAQSARETLRDGHWWFPHVNGQPYRDKPPLYFWATAVVSAPFGDVDEWTARIPSVLFALALVAVVFDLGRRTASIRAGATAAIVLATAWLVAWMARRVNLDVPLAACSTASIWCMVRAGLAARTPGRAFAPLAWAAAAGACAALGAMLKGPVVALPVVGALAALAAHPASRADRPRGFAVRAAAAGVFGTAAVLAAWLIPAATLGGYDVLSVAREHVVERAAEGRHHIRPVFYYLTTLPVDFLPWTFLAVPAAWAAWRRRRDRLDAMLLGWFLVPAAVLSIVVEKRNLYVLPILPALALMIGRWVDRVEDGEEREATFRRVAAAVAALSTVLAAGAVAAAIAGGRIPALDEAWSLPGLPGRVRLLALLAALGAALSIAGLRRAGAADRTRWLAAGFALVELGVFVLLPAVDPLKSARAMGEVIRAEVGDRPLAMFPFKREGFVYYADRFVVECTGDAELLPWLAAAPRPAYVLTYRRYVDRLPPDGDGPPREVGGAAVGSRDAVLVRYASPGGSLPSAPSDGAP